MFMLCFPADVYHDPHIIACTHQTSKSHDLDQVQPQGDIDPQVTSPTRRQLLDALQTDQASH